MLPSVKRRLNGVRRRECKRIRGCDQTEGFWEVAVMSTESERYLLSDSGSLRRGAFEVEEQWLGSHMDLSNYFPSWARFWGETEDSREHMRYLRED